MAFTFGVGPTDNYVTGSNNTVTLTLNGTTAGRAIIVGAFFNGASSPSTETISSITCSGESNLTIHGSPARPSNNNANTIQHASLANITVGGSKTIVVTLSGAVSKLGAFAIEVAGGNTSSFFDNSAIANAGSGNPTLSLTTGGDSALIVASASKDLFAITGNGAGYTDISIPTFPNSNRAEYDLDAGAAGAKTVDFVRVQESLWAESAVSFNVAPPSAAAFNLPALTFVGVGGFLGFFKDLPMLTLAAGNKGATFNLPMLTLSAAGVQESLGIANFNLPKFTFVAVGGGVDAAEFSLPMLTLSAAGSAGGVGIAQPVLPILTLSATGVTGDVGTVAFNLPALTIAITATQSGFGDAAFDLPFPTLSAIGFTGGLGTAAFDLPVLTLSVAAYQSSTGEAAFNLPLLYLDAQGAVTLTASYRTWVLNLRNGALTEYNNFSYNSYTNFNGVVLACGPSGVFVLGTQATDAGTEISAKFRTGKPSFDTGFVTRVPRLYVDANLGGDMTFRTITSESGQRSYLLPSNNVVGFQQRRVPIGRGPKSLYWQFEGENVAGSDFKVKSVMAYPTKLRRRFAG